MKTTELINLLCLPESYPHPVDVITTIETHISVVFLTGPYAYKLKKPVDFGFLNFSTLSQRKKFCDLELQLNQRYAPQLYLDVMAVCLNHNNQITLQPSKSLIERSSTDKESLLIDYLVKMNQFDPNQVLGKRLQSESLNSQQIESLAFQIADFHQTAEKIQPNTELEEQHRSELGEPKTILQPMTDNFPILYSQFSAKRQPELESLEHWTLDQYQQLMPLIRSRKTEGYVRACHGDLHIDNITLIDDVPMLFDGIEFNEAFRWIDVISDLAFLLIDLDYRKKSTLKRKVLSLYLSRTGDYNALKLLPFYQVYRTLVRAKITTLRACQLPDKSLEQTQMMSTAMDYIDLASTYTQVNKSPKLILLQGVSGSGKSHLAEQLLTQIDGLILSSDRVRKRLYGIEPLHRISESEKSTLYSPEMNQRVYMELLNQAKQLLKLGINVIVDATFLQRQHRDRFYTMSQSLSQSKSLEISVSCHLIYIKIQKELANFAIQSRQQQNNNPSDAAPSVMLKQIKSIESPAKDEKALTLEAQQLRRFFPKQLIQEFLNRPI